MLRFIPNALTLLRGCVLTPAIGLIFLWHSLAYFALAPSPEMYFPYKSWACIIMLLAILTDAVDGRLARMYDWKSDFGARVDPLMDKVFSYTCFICVPVFFGLDWYLLWFVPFCVYINQYSIDTTRMRKRREILEANEYAQRKTGFLFATQIFFFLAIALEDVVSGTWLTLMVQACFLIAFATMFTSCVLCSLALEEYEKQKLQRSHQQAIAARSRFRIANAAGSVRKRNAAHTGRVLLLE